MTERLVLIIFVFMEMEKHMIDNDKLLSEVFNKLNEMSKEEFTEILKKAALRKEKNNASID